METLTLKAVIDSEYFNNPPHLKIDINDDVLFDSTVTEEISIEQDLQVKDDQVYHLNFTLYNKSMDDTEIDNDGNIIRDTLIKIKNIEIDDTDITRMLPLDQEKFYYKHVTGTVDPFYDTMGVNGTSTIEFTTPFYVWLLETL